MLDFMRRNAKSWFIKVALGVISLVFIFFLGGGTQIRGTAQSAVAIVDGEEISLRQFQRAQIRNESFFRNQYGDRLTPELLAALDIPSSTLAQLVDGALLRHEAARLGLAIPDEAVRHVIQTMDAFQRDGSFSPSLYRAALQRQGYSPSGFEESIRSELLIDQIRGIIERGVHVTEDEAFEDFKRRNEKVSLSYLHLQAKDFRDEVEIDDGELQAYFERNGQNYLLPPRVSVKYIAYSPDKLEAEAEPTEEQILEYYHLNLEDEFTREEAVSARHILKKFPPAADDDAKAETRKAIEAVKARLDKGEKFEDVAQEESEDSSADKGGDLGSFKRGMMVKPFEEAAFGLDVGATSDIVETRFGFHIIQAYDRQEAGVDELEDVRETIAGKLRSETLGESIFEMAAEDGSALYEGASLDEIAESRGLKSEITPLFSKGDPIPGIDKPAAFVRAALALGEVGDSSDSVKIDGEYYLMEVAERWDAHVPELEVVREKVERDFTKEKASEAARARADELLEQMRAGKSLESLAEAGGGKLDTTEKFGRGGPFVPGLGNVAGLKELAFAAKKEGEALPRSFLHRGDAYVFALRERETPPRSDFEDSKEEAIDGVRVAKRQKSYEDFIRGLKESAEISYNNDVLATVIPR